MKKATLITVAFLILAAALILFAKKKKDEWIEEKRFQMATVTKIVIPRTNESASALAEAFAAIDEVERAASRFIPESEINKLSDGRWHKLSPVLLPMWEKAKELYELSGGRFDPTAGKLISLWGFGPEGIKKEPTAEEIEEALRYTGLDKVETSNGFIRLPFGMRLDLNSLAAGYAADRAAAVLKKRGFKKFLVDAGGEIVCASDGKKIWEIGIKDPEKDSSGYMVLLWNGAVSTSGSYANFYKSGSNSFTHIVDARTGKAAKTALLSVTTAAGDGITADGWSTMLFCLPTEEGKALAEKYEEPAALFLEKSPDLKEGELRVKSFRGKIGSHFSWKDDGRLKTTRTGRWYGQWDLLEINAGRE
jgi:thiamine biosynthesis lipoprotein